MKVTRTELVRFPQWWWWWWCDAEEACCSLSQYVRAQSGCERPFDWGQISFTLLRVDTTLSSWPLRGPTGVSEAASRGGEEEEMRGKMEWLWQVSWWLWERKGVGIKAQAVILLYSLQRDNLLKWGMAPKSKWADLKPLGHCPPAGACVIASTPTLIDSLCHCLIMVWLFFPGTDAPPPPIHRLRNWWHVGGETGPEMQLKIVADFDITAHLPGWLLVCCLWLS